ncbi:MAG: hypothetical protein QOE70_3852 [Chthoniobacter sp.]|jgi:hypothetical protein|nr:hypothetical protein [Chthoniobacter sp.]
MPEPKADNRRAILAVVAVALLIGWIMTATFLGSLPRPFIAGLVAFDVFILYFIWRLLGPGNGP